MSASQNASTVRLRVRAGAWDPSRSPRAPAEAGRCARRDARGIGGLEGGWMRALGVVMLLVLSLGGSWAATQYVAAGLHCAPELGPPWAAIGDERIYPPWGWVVWARKCPSRAPTLFRNASAIATLAALAGAAAAALAALRRGPSAASIAHGSSRWATT